MLTTSQSETVSGLLAEFVARAEPVGTTVQTVSDSAAAAAALNRLAREIGTTSISISGDVRKAAPEMVATLEADGFACRTPTDANDALDAPLGVSLARRAVAETGSLLLAEESLADRSVGLVSITHVTICRTSDLVPSLADAAIVLREIASRPHGGYATLVTGPSRTADIEMSLTVGVQGPAKVYALFVENMT